MVAVAVPCSPPPQHSPIFGHLASSQTVCKFNFLNCSLSLLKFFPVGIVVFSQGGNLNRSSSPLALRSLPSYSFHSSTSSFRTGLGFLTKSCRLGPFIMRCFRFSRLFVCFNLQCCLMEVIDQD